MPDALPHLYLVDGSSCIFRAYHRLPPLTDRRKLAPALDTIRDEEAA
jgi:hypothetical protein